jgi:tetratricopeptide (TPR) repeat protein
VYAALLPLTTASSRTTVADERAGEENRDPTRPFRLPLLAPGAGRRARSRGADKLTDAEAELLLDSVGALLDGDHPAAAIGLLEDGIERADHDPALQLRLRHQLGAALFYAGEYTRAATVLDAAGGDYRRYFPPDYPDVLDCAYHAGLAYAEIGKPGKALPQLRFYVRNADVSLGGRGPQGPRDPLRHRANACRRGLSRRGAG